MAQFRKDTHRYLSDGKTIFETVMLADQYGNMVGAANPSGVAVDAFGRARVSQPLTLFDSSHRYKDNGLWDTSNTAGTTYAFNANAGLIELNLPTTADAEIIRETSKVFVYQPGKSLQVMNTFVMNAAKTNLRQRVGYFGAQNGVYVELDGSTLSFVLRSSVSGSLVETKVTQSNWNMDTLLGSVNSSPSGVTLDITKAQISFFDIEWLGLGTVRCGFVIDGQLIHCHSFHHANLITATYMTTACLPLRYEIKNSGTTASSSTMKQVCSTVISEGGYELFGSQQAIGTLITAPKDLATAGTYYPVVGIRLKSTTLDAIVIPTALSVMGLGNGINFAWRVTEGATITTAGGFLSAGNDSSVEYVLDGSATTGGTILASGFLNSSNQGSPTIDVLRDALFKFQLERNGLTGTPTTLSLEVAASTNSQTVHGSLDWEEISR